MASITINTAQCKGCALCISACPKNIIAIGTESNRGGYFSAEVVQPSSCIGCARCAIMCPDCCITVMK
ncbi:MAG: 4Fe-4S binding protein [Christensenellaceae bacterium]|nr:4Fe-4S binding protein [Christensenellaceae bacterium]